MGDEQKAEGASVAAAAQVSQPKASYTEEQVRAIVAASAMSNPKFLELGERALKLADTYVGGVVHEKKLLAWSKPIIFVIVLIAVGVLKYIKAFDSDVAVLIGTIAGYFFGRNKANE